MGGAKFSDTILEWYSQHKRKLPWRSTTDPYKIWLSEVILQQTRVAQGIPYYEKFVDKYPTVEDLASADEEEVLKLWQGLGYYSRARNMLHTAKAVVDEYQGRFPKSYKGLLALKGVGDYTASAIASISFNLPEAVVDGNVYRVLARYFGVDLPIDQSAGKRYFKELALEQLHLENTRDYNQGLMEFGAVQCAPRNPDCYSCPLADSCVALATGRVQQLPVKSRKVEVRKRYFNYLVVLDKLNNTRLTRRTTRDIWQQLYEFPLIESEGTIEIEELERRGQELLELKDSPGFYAANSEAVVHKLSHQHLYTRFWIVRTGGLVPDGIPLSEIEAYPVPVLIADFIKTLKNSYF